MWFRKRYAEIAFGLLVLGLTLATNTLPPRWRYNLEAIRLLQFSATLALLFGVLKAHEKHKGKLFLLWLCITTASFISMLYAGLQMLCQSGLGFGTIISWSLAAAISFLLNIMYNNYVELTIESAELVTEVVLTNQPPAFEKKNQFILY